MKKKWMDDIDLYLSKKTSLEEVRAKDNNRVEEIIEYVKKNSKFYAEHLSNKCNETSEIEALNEIPFTTKSDLRSVGTDVCSLSFDEIATYYETTGTTGKPTPCPRAAIDVETSGAYVKNALKNIYNHTFGTTNALTAIMGPSELYAFGDTYGEACRSLNIPFVRLWPESPRVGLEKAGLLIQKLQVKSLICSPAIALALARYYKSIGIEPKDTSVKEILMLGELCTPEMLANISDIWSAHCTHGLYGSQEVHAVATGCICGNLHLSETNYVAEIIPIEGISEEVGELCLTMLVPGAKPLIRFRTGDLAHIYEEINCECGNKSRCIKVYGRVDDITEIGGKKMLPAQIESVVLGVTKRVDGYQVDIKTNDCGEDELEVSIVSQFVKEPLNEIEKQLSEYFGVRVKVSIPKKLDPRTETGAYISWKHARIRDWRRKHD